MKLLSGLELVGFIKERQARDVRRLKQSRGVIPKLAIVVANNQPVIETYVRLKQNYAEDILIETTVKRAGMAELDATLNELNSDKSVSSIILQLPLSETEKTDEYVAKIMPEKDVDGLGSDAFFTPATASAIDWLVNGYNINLREKKIAIVGSNGRLVGRPLMKLWSRYNPAGFDVGSNLDELKNYNLIVSATGQAGLITTDFIAINSVIIDAGVASESGKTVGDASPELYERDDLTITPPKGGVGPLTVAALFDNVIRSASMEGEYKK